MKKVFVKTNNVKRFITMMNNLQNRAEGVPGMGLVYGEPGLGKTQTINWWAFKNNAILVRCTQLMTARWLLNEIMDEMGEVNCGRLADCFKIIIRNLLTEPQVIIVDEVDYLAIDSVGMSNAKSRIKRFKHLYDRLSEIVQFKPFSKNDIAGIVKELSEIEMTECAIKCICTNVNRFRQIVKIINKAECYAKANGLNSIDEIIIKEILNDEATDKETVQTAEQV